MSTETITIIIMAADGITRSPEAAPGLIFPKTITREKSGIKKAGLTNKNGMITDTRDGKMK
jgi:hypothetical protein